MPGYAGPGFIGTIGALRHITAARHPERWCDEAIPEEERQIWDAFGLSREGDLFEEALAIEVTQPSPSLVHRVIDYREAANELRDKLVADRIRIHFRVESGEIGPPVSSHCWASDIGLQALLRGAAWIDEGEEEVCRFLIISEKHLSEVLAFTTTTSTQSPRSAGERTEIKARPRGARPKYDWDALLEKLRAAVDAKNGLPDLTGSENWQRDADGERLLLDICEAQGGEPGEATVRRYWTKFRKNYEAQKGS